MSVNNNARTIGIIALCKCFARRVGNELLLFFVKCEWGKLACTMPMIKGYVLGVLRAIGCERVEASSSTGSKGKRSPEKAKDLFYLLNKKRII